jgi:hypothetical protein
MSYIIDALFSYGSEQIICYNTWSEIYSLLYINWGKPCISRKLFSSYHYKFKDARVGNTPPPPI